MNLFEVLAEIVSLFHAPTSSNDRSVVGESPMDRKAARIWRGVGYAFAAAVALGAVYFYVVHPWLHRVPPPPPPLL